MAKQMMYRFSPVQVGPEKRRHAAKEILKMGRDKIEKSPTMVRFRATHDGGKQEEIFAYGQIMDLLGQHTGGEHGVWHFRRIVGHRGPIQLRNKKLRPSKAMWPSPYQLLAEFENLIHFGHVSTQMDGHDAAGTFRDRRTNLIGVDLEGGTIGIHEDR